MESSSTASDVARLQEENRLLKEEVETLNAQLIAVRHDVHHHHHSKTSVLHTGKQVKISAEEIEAMRAIFSLFDAEKTGKIRAHALKELHHKLGEPITDDEAKDAVEQLGHGNDYFTFEDFVAYWDGVHPSQRALHEEDDVEMSGAAAAGSSISTGSAHSSPEAIERHRKRKWYQARFKFVKAKIANPKVGRIYAVEHGPCPSLEYRVRFYQNDESSGAPVEISPWHDVPYKNDDGTYNMVVEIPKWTRHKFEIATGEEFNPIKQDTKNGKLRDYGWGDMLFNYGAIPQTWENPKLVHPATGAVGDNDPIDAVDIGSKMWTTGSIVRVKVLGVLAMIDSGETDWKLVCINVEDPLAKHMHDIDDVKVQMPGAVEALHHWLKYYKSPDINEFGFEGKAQNRHFAEEVLEETHVEWKKLVEERKTVSK